MEKWDDERCLVMVGNERDLNRGRVSIEGSLKKKAKDSWRRRLWSRGMPWSGIHWMIWNRKKDESVESNIVRLMELHSLAQ